MLLCVGATNLAEGERTETDRRGLQKSCEQVNHVLSFDSSDITPLGSAQHITPTRLKNKEIP